MKAEIVRRRRGRRWEGVAVTACVLACIALALMAGCSGPTEEGPPGADARAGGELLTILHFNDFHGNVLVPESEEGEEEPLGGIARLASAVDAIRAENQQRGVQTLVLVAGDVVQGTPLSTVFKGEVEFRALNALGVDACVVGNHEFDFGTPNLHTLVELAQFPVLSANIRRKSDGELAFESGRRFEVGPEIVAVIGLTTPETRVTTMPSNVANFDFEDPAEALGVQIEQLSAERDPLAIALTHLGEAQDRELAEQVAGIDVIVGGHSHTRLDEPVEVGNALIVQAGAYGEYLGRLDLTVSDGAVVDYEYELLPIDGSWAEQEEVAAVVAEYQGELSEAMQEVVGRTEVALDGVREHVRSRETNLGNAITDAMRLVSGAPIALENGGGIRASIDEGEITLEEVLQVLPFGNEVATVTLTGEQLREIIQRSVSEPAPFGGFLQVSGLKVVAEDGDLAELTANGEAIDPNGTYQVATNAFLLEGGDGYDTFTEGRDPYYVGTKLDTAFVQYLSEHETIAPEIEGRIVIR